jgi:hypothetical protein
MLIATERHVTHPLFGFALSLGFMPEQHIEHLRRLTVAAASLSQDFTFNVKVYEKLTDSNKVL